MRRSAPEAQGVLSAGILQFLDAAAASKIEFHSLMIARHGQVVAEGWWAPYRPDAVHLLYSLTKSFTSTAVGFAVTEGRLSVDDPVTKFFVGELPSPVSANLSALRVEHLLTMSAGHASETNAVITETSNWTKAFLAQPIAHAPGSTFMYDSGCSFMLAAIVQKITGQKLQDYLQPRLFAPLGIEGVTWETNPSALNIGGWGLSVTTEMLVKFGQFYLQEGQWNGKQLLAKEWVSRATSFHIQQPASPGGDLDKLKRTSDAYQGYGYQFWRCRHSAFRGEGAFGQLCIVMPDRDAVIAITSCTNDTQTILDLVWKNLLPAIQGESLPLDSQASSKLRKALASLALPLPAGSATSPTASALRGKSFALEPNALGVTSVAFDFTGAVCAMRVQTAKGTSEIRCGLGNWMDGVTDMPGTPPKIRESSSPEKDRPTHFNVAAACAWQDEQTLAMHWRFYETPHHDRVTCRFAGERVSIEFANSITLLNAQSHPETRAVLEGRARA
jgi:CubicO group peptidase (beta-lactamase class C family)